MESAVGCPRCKVPLGPSAIDIADQECARCRGCFLSAANTARLLEQQGFTPDFLRQLLAAQGGVSFPCMECKQVMRVGQVRGRTVDLCTHCGGMWLDGGELGPLSHGMYTNGELRRLPPQGLKGNHVISTTEPGGCMRTAALMYAGGFGCVMGLAALATGSVALGLAGAAALGLTVMVLWRAEVEFDGTTRTVRGWMGPGFPWKRWSVPLDANGGDALQFRILINRGHRGGTWLSYAWFLRSADGAEHKVYERRDLNDVWEAGPRLSRLSGLPLQVPEEERQRLPESMAALPRE